MPISTSLMSYLTHLACANCNSYYDPHTIQTFCHTCRAPILAHYDLSTARHKIDRDNLRHRSRGMWRWGELLPNYDLNSVVTLGEGDTPLIHLYKLGAQLDLRFVYLKDESFNPTGSFKARGMSAAISKAKELGIKKVVMPTAGNAGGALAAYAARAGMNSLIYMPQDTPRANIVESIIVGSTVVCIPGLISDAASFAQEKAQQEGWFDMSTFKEPYRVEGKKVMGYELAEAFEWNLPDVIIYPAGGGTGLVGIWKAFAELQELGWLSTTHMPRMIAIQAEGCAPLVKAFEEGSLHCDFWVNAQTIASGLRVPKSFADQLVLQNIRDSKGTAITVSDSEMIMAQKILATTEGIFASPEGAATLAGLIKLIQLGQVGTQERCVLFNTCTGLKYLENTDLCSLTSQMKKDKLS